MYTGVGTHSVPGVRLPALVEMLLYGPVCAPGATVKTALQRLLDAWQATSGDAASRSWKGRYPCTHVMHGKGLIDG